MKRLLSLLFSGLMLTLLFSGCGTIYTYAPEGTTGLRGTVKISLSYITKQLYEKAIKKLQDDNPDLTIKTAWIYEFNQDTSPDGYTYTLGEENLAQEEVPDLFLVSPTMDLNDLERLARQGYLLDLQTYMESDATLHDADYYLEVLEAGKWKDAQYYLPLQFSPAMLLSTEAVYQDAAMALQEGYTAAELFAALEQYCAQYDAEEAGYPYPLLGQPGAPTCLTLLQSVGVPLYRPQDGTLSLPDNEIPGNLLEFALTYQILQQDFQEHPPLGFSGGSEKVFAPFLAKQAAFVFRPMFLSPSRLFDAANAMAESANQLQVIPIPQFDDASRCAAQIEVAGAISAAADNPSLCYVVLRALMDTYDGLLNAGFSVNRAETQNALQKAREKGYEYVAEVENVLDRLGRSQLAPCEYLENLAAPKLADCTDTDTLRENIYDSIEQYLNSDRWFEGEYAYFFI